MDNRSLELVIDEILSYYFNRNTRMSYDVSVQKDMVGQNRGLKNACCAVIKFSDNPEELADYVGKKINEINEGEVQEVRFN